MIKIQVHAIAFKTSFAIAVRQVCTCASALNITHFKPVQKATGRPRTTLWSLIYICFSSKPTRANLNRKSLYGEEHWEVGFLRERAGQPKPSPGAPKNPCGMGLWNFKNRKKSRFCEAKKGAKKGQKSCFHIIVDFSTIRRSFLAFIFDLVL